MRVKINLDPTHLATLTRCEGSFGTSDAVLSASGVEPTAGTSVRNKPLPAFWRVKPPTSLLFLDCALQVSHYSWRSDGSQDHCAYRIEILVRSVRKPDEVSRVRVNRFIYLVGYMLR